MNNSINNLDKEFIKLTNGEKLYISKIEDLMIENLDDYKKALNKHIEELLQHEVDENNLIVKKTRMEK